MESMGAQGKQTEPGTAGSERAAGAGHFATGPDGPEARMVDVGDKVAGERRALARARIRLGRDLLGLALGQGGPKGPLREVARTAGILAAKRTDEWIPMCHSLALDHVEVRFEAFGEDCLDILCSVRCRAATGVEMEALVGASAAALTVYDMLKGIERGIRIETVELLEKRGGRSGTWLAPGHDPGRGAEGSGT